MTSFINMLRAAYARAYRYLVDRNIAIVDSEKPISQMSVKEAVSFTVSRVAELLMWYGPSLLVASAVTAIVPWTFVSFLLLVRPEIVNNLVFDIEPSDTMGSFEPVFR